MMLEVTNRVDDKILKKIQISAAKKDITEQELITQIILEGVDQIREEEEDEEYKVPEMLQIDESKGPVSDIDEINKLLGNDETKSKIDLNDYLGIVSSPQPTDSLQEKRESYIRG